MNAMWLISAFLMGFFTFYLIFRIRKGGFEALATAILHRAEMESAKLEIALKEKEFAHQNHLKELTDQQQQKLAREKEKLEKREEKLDGQLSLVDRKLSETEKKEKKLGEAQLALEVKYKEACALENGLIAQLELLSGFTKDEAKSYLFEKIRGEVEQEALKVALRLKKETESEAEKKASEVVAMAIGRLSLATISEITTTTVSLQNDEMKGRIVGREGRNIRTLELLTGVNFVIEDSNVVISGFDPIRREIAKLAIKELIKDGRIHPTRIEEVVCKVKETLDKRIKEYGENAALRANVHHLHPELIKYLGTLQFRTSFGQNVLEHSLEVSHLMGMIASELQLDPQLARRIGLLHDIGKALSHEMEGSHALVGRDLALKCGESEEVANGIGCHHDEILPTTIEASLCAAADRISGARPAARMESMEHTLKRNRKLEALSSQFPGVEQAYVLQAGRELRVIVEPNLLDDSATVVLARDIAKKIEKELSYPGKIKVTVIREKRCIEYAT